jgi:hypothetical protein
MCRNESRVSFRSLRRYARSIRLSWAEPGSVWSSNESVAGGRSYVIEMRLPRVHEADLRIVYHAADAQFLSLAVRHCEAA